MAWIYLFIAGLFEIVWAFALKQSDGFTRPGTALVAAAMKSLPLGTAYMVWTGIGAVGAFVVGIVVLGEAVSPVRIIAALLIVAGLALMKWSAPA